MKNRLFLPLFLLLSILCACSDLSALRRDHPIFPVHSYERLIVGRLDANYIGNKNCLGECHKHDRIDSDFQRSVHGEQVAAETGLPLVNCESCHGPGSLAVENLADPQKCNFESLLQLNQLPSQAQSLICLKCHSADSTPNLQFWNGSGHANADVSCYDCHRLHQGPQQKAGRREMAELCFACHQEIRMAFNQFSHHPVPELKMVCSDCHDPHGTANDHHLKGTTVKETCSRCHMEKQGPFVYEHADVTEDCSNCHRPHGSPNDRLLSAIEPFLCLQCHAGHLDAVHPALATDQLKEAFYSRCTDCHSAIHGTDIPSAKGRGTFIAR